MHDEVKVIHIRKDTLRYAKMVGQVKQYEKDYPEFRDAYAYDPCDGTDYVARIYGWGPATTAYEDYGSLRWLLDDDSH